VSKESVHGLHMASSSYVGEFQLVDVGGDLMISVTWGEKEEMFGNK
jgi:hypothetical protein